MNNLYSINKNQTEIISGLEDLIKKRPATELPNLLKDDQLLEIKLNSKYLYSNTTSSRRMGNFYKINDYYYYFTHDDDTIPNILDTIKINDVTIDIDMESLSKLMIKINAQLFNSEGKIHWFSKKDSENYQTLKLKKNTLLLLPIAVPDPYIKTKRPSIPRTLREMVWKETFNNKIRGNCYVCNKRVYNKQNGWHCAHNIPYIICRKHDLVNLHVSCPTCNLQCGTLVLDVFKINKTNKT